MFGSWWSWGPKGRVLLSPAAAAGCGPNLSQACLGAILSLKWSRSLTWTWKFLASEAVHFAACTGPAAVLAAAMSATTESWSLTLCHGARPGTGIASGTPPRNQTGMQTLCRASALHGLLWCGLDRRKLQADVKIVHAPRLQVTEIARSYVSYMT